jgi:hypothetical protein
MQTDIIISSLIDVKKLPKSAEVVALLMDAGYTYNQSMEMCQLTKPNKAAHLKTWASIRNQIIKQRQPSSFDFKLSEDGFPCMVDCQPRVARRKANIIAIYTRELHKKKAA